MKSFMEIDVSDVSVNHEGSIQLKDNVNWKYGRDAGIEVSLRQGLLRCF